MESIRKFRAAVIQLRSRRDVEPSIESAVELITEASANGAQYILTPENTNLMELRSKFLFEKIEHERDDPGLQNFLGLAQKEGIWLHIGGMAIKLSDNKIANRSYLLSPDGKIAASYDKIHMFDVYLPNGESYRESKNYEAGESSPVAQLPWGRIGLTICYDIRFPQLYRKLAKAGSEIIAIPSAFTRQTGQAHWHVLLRARAIETGCFVFAAAQCGHHECGRQTYGHSMIINPWGEIIGEAGNEPGIIYGDIDLAQVKQAREKMPSLAHDRSFSVNPSENLEEIRDVS